MFDHGYNDDMRVQIPLDQVLRLVTPGPVTLVSAFHKDRFTITPVGWTTHLSLRPPIIGIVVQQSRFLVELIRASGEFGISIVSKQDAGTLFRAGFISGRDQEDKFTASGLKPISGKRIAAPLLDTALAHIECSAERGTEFHDHILFAGEVLYAEADEHAFDGTWLGGERSPLAYMGLNRFSTYTDRFIPS